VSGGAAYRAVGQAGAALRYGAPVAYVAVIGRGRHKLVEGDHWIFVVSLLLGQGFSTAKHSA
jgi:hypothetical protein